MGKDKKTKLRNPDIKKIDLVDDGANPGARIMLYKRNDTDDPGDIPQGTEPKGLVKTIIGRIAKALGWDQAQIDKAMEETAQPTAHSFDQAMEDRKWRRIYGEIWDYTYALQESLESTIRDQTMDKDDKQDLLLENLEQFITTIEAAIPMWCRGNTVEKVNDEGGVEKVGRKISAARLDRMKTCRSALDELIKEAEENPEGDPGEPTIKINDEEVEKMGFDVTKLSPEAQKYIAQLEKRATDAETARQTAENAKKTAEAELQKMKDEHPTEEDIYKGMSPAAVKKMKDMEAEIEKAKTAEYVNKAKAFEPIGVKADEFGPVLKTISQKCPEQYAEIEKALEQAAAIAKTGEVFKEAGMETPANAGGSALVELQKKATEIAKRDGISAAAAMEKAGDENPELLAKYREELRK